MPRPFLQLSPEDFLDLLRRFPFRRQINAVHMHHTWIPRRSQYRGVASIEAMDRDHRVNRGFSDIAQHITIAPDGTIWTGRSWNQQPASARGHNGNSISGPFMFEMIGDFDQGREAFGGAQKETALTVIAHVQKRFKLPPESLRFHNQMSEKTCPGSSIPYDQFLEEVRAKRREIEDGERAERARAEGAPFGDEHAETASASGVVQLALDALVRSAARGQEEDGELDENDMAPERRSFLSGDDGYTEAAPVGADRGLFGPRQLTAEEKARLRPHVVNLREGQLIPGGDFSSSAEDVRAIFTEHLEREAARRQQEGKDLRLVFYAHGGLVPELSGLHRALTHVDWWMENGVYPIYFVWETGLLQTIGQILRRGEEARGLRDRLAEFRDSLIEKAARRLGGERIWSGMKRNAERASAPDGGAELVAGLLKAFCDRHPGVELHAVGHSAGAIFHSHFLPAAFAQGTPAFKSLHLLAPAVRTDTFLGRLKPEIDGNRIQHLTMFTMKKDFELADNCAQIYGKSLLYLIHNALEPEEGAELLGLEESVRRDRDLVRLFGLEGNPGGDAEIVFSKSLADSGRSASHSTAHGDFDDDQKTMNSIALRVLGLPDNGVIKPYPQGKSRSIEDPWAPPDLSDLFPPVPPS
ncbi:MAG TPA: peptidoglycan recognition family protein, partial [Thermoanaerobaculia bacterium]|nr:peptidoglycan recognition family protein [Thermoanaerobaculia bacterium]